MSNSIRDNIRQWLRYPQEFRISAPKYFESSEFIKALDDSLKQPTIGSLAISEEEEALINLAVDVGTLVWRIQRRLATISEIPKQLQRLSRDVESTWDAFTQRGIEIKDHTGRDYDGGMTLRVITFQPMAGLSRQQIIETLKPTIYYRDRIIQMGEVIVGVPEETETSRQV
ncbi:hypothetical protein ACFLW8_02300 [Chloroflexota bacterium]